MTAYLDRVRQLAGDQPSLQVRPRSRFEPLPPNSAEPGEAVGRDRELPPAGSFGEERAGIAPADLGQADDDSPARSASRADGSAGAASGSWSAGPDSADPGGAGFGLTGGPDVATAIGPWAGGDRGDSARGPHDRGGQDAGRSDRGRSDLAHSAGRGSRPGSRLGSRLGPADPDADVSGVGMPPAHPGGSRWTGARPGRTGLAGRGLSGTGLADAAASGPGASDKEASDKGASGLNLAGPDTAGTGLADSDLAGAGLGGTGLADSDLADSDLASAGLRDAGLGDAGLGDVGLNGAGLAGPRRGSLPGTGPWAARAAKGRPASGREPGWGADLDRDPALVRRARRGAGALSLDPSAGVASYHLDLLLAEGAGTGPGAAGDPAGAARPGHHRASPPPAAGRPDARSQARPDEVTVTIGRVEVRVGPPAAATPAPADRGARPARSQPRGLDDYLRARASGRVG